MVQLKAASSSGGGQLRVALSSGGTKWWEVSVIKINEYEINIHTYGLKRHVLDMSLRPVYPAEGSVIEW